MREIKFRGKTASGEWVYGDLVQRRLKNTVFIEHIEKDKHWLTAIIFETIGQYTGIKDKNGKEIFEGDIVKVYDDYNAYEIMAGEIYEIYFAFGGFRLKPKHNPNARGNWVEDGIDFEVIGNIHDNPELLEAQPNDR